MEENFDIYKKNKEKYDDCKSIIFDKIKKVVLKIKDDEDIVLTEVISFEFNNFKSIHFVQCVFNRNLYNLFINKNEITSIKIEGTCVDSKNIEELLFKISIDKRYKILQYIGGFNTESQMDITLEMLDD